MKQNLQCTGISLHQGEFNGRSYDFARIYVLERMNSNNQNMVGFSTTEFKVESRYFHVIKDHEFPLDLQADIFIESLGAGKSQTVLSNIVVLDSKKS